MIGHSGTALTNETGSSFYYNVYIWKKSEWEESLQIWWLSVICYMF